MAIRTAVALALLVAVTRADTAISPPPNSNLVVRARLLTGPARTTPHCGTLYVGEVLQWEVLQVLQGDYQRHSLYATHGCSEMLTVGVGEEATLTLTGVRPSEVTVIDRFAEPQPKRWWAERIVLPSDPCPVLARLRNGWVMLSQSSCPDVSITVGANGELPPPSLATLAKLVKELHGQPRLTRLELEGSKSRARAVMAWLINHGIDADRLDQSGHGGDQIWFEPSQWDHHQLEYR